jgi:hypothetical protein
MSLDKCDVCKKIVATSKERILIEYPWVRYYILCLECGTPVVKFLKKCKLIEEKRA